MKNKKNAKSSSIMYRILLFLTLFACLRPQYFDYYSWTKIAYMSVLITAAFFGLMLYITRIKRFKFTNIATLYFAILLLSTVFYHLTLQNILFFIKTYLSIWVIVLLSEYAILTEKKKELFETVGIFTFIMTALNVLFIITKGPNSLGLRSAFLGYDNTVLPFILFGAVISYFSPRIADNKGKMLAALSYMNTAIIIINCLIVESSNAKIAAVMMLVMIILDKTRLFENRYLNKFLNFKTYVFFSIIAFLAIVVFRMQYLFEDIIVNDLNRNLSITGRTTIWDYAISQIQQNPLFGTGVEDFSLRIHDNPIFHAHSTYLNIAYECGIIGLIAYLNIFRRIWNEIKNDKANKVIALISFATLIYFVLTIIEYYKNSHTFFILLMLLFYAPSLTKHIRKNKSNDWKVETT